jgi:hypothetical protein
MRVMKCRTNLEQLAVIRLGFVEDTAKIHRLARQLRLWVILSDASGADALLERVTTWAKSFGSRATQRRAGPIVSIDATIPTKLWKSARAKLDDALTETALAVSPWHGEIARDPRRALGVLARTVSVKPAKYARSDVKRSAEHDGADLRTLLLDTIEGNLPAELAHAVIESLRRGAKTRAARAVLDDVLEEHLPSMFGVDFDLDVVMRDALAIARGLSPTSIEMPARFYRESERRMTAGNHTSRVHATDGKVDWKNLDEVRKAVADGAGLRALNGLDDATPAHAKTLLALTHDERLAVVKKHAALALRVANIAAHVLARREYVAALALYDAALEGELPPGALANPLFAVQNDNNRLGIDANRARRYLERCLGNSPEDNPTIFLNASFVYMEIGEPDEAMRVLALAKKHGISVKEHRNEALFGPLRALPEFARLMR